MSALQPVVHHASFVFVQLLGNELNSISCRRRCIHRVVVAAFFGAVIVVAAAAVVVAGAVAVVGAVVVVGGGHDTRSCLL